MEALGGLELPGTPANLPTTSDISVSLNSGYLSIARFRISSRGITDITAGFDQFFNVVRAYTRRNLTFDGDSLVAFAGVSHHLRNAEPKVSHVLGIPYMPSILELGNDDGHIVYSLCWFHNGNEPPRRRAQFPSWTWAGWAGEVHWMTGKLGENLYTDEPTIIPKIKHIRFKDEEHISPLEDYLRSYDPSHAQINGSKLSLHFEARVVPSSLFIWETENRTNEPDTVSVATVDNDSGTHSFHSRKERDRQEDREHSKEAIETRSEEKNISERESQEPRFNQPAMTVLSENRSEEHDMIETDERMDKLNWDDWTVGMHGLWNRSRVPDFSPLEFLENIRDNRWCCLLIADYNSNAGYSHRRFLLVIEWLNDGSARRVGSLVLNQHYYVDADYPSFFDDEDLDWTTVRLV